MRFALVCWRARQQNRETSGSRNSTGGRISKTTRTIRGFTEVLLIALGIVLGLSAESWLDERGDRVREREYLVALRQEFESTREHLVSVVEAEEARQEVGAGLIRASRERLRLDSDSIRDRLLGVARITRLAPTTATVDQLISSGDLSLIRDAGIRTALSSWSVASTTELSHVLAMGREQWTELGRPFFRESTGQVAIYQLYAEIDLGASADYMAVLHSSELRDYLAGRLIYSRDTELRVERLVRLADDALTALAAAM